MITFVWRARPEILENTYSGRPLAGIALKRIVIGFAITAVLTGGALSWFASTHPDGLEWSIFQTSGKEDLPTRNQIQRSLATVQEKTAFLPDYDLKGPHANQAKPASERPTAWPNINTKTTSAGLIGVVLTLLLAGLIGFGLRLLRNRFK